MNVRTMLRDERRASNRRSASIILPQRGQDITCAARVGIAGLRFQSDDGLYTQGQVVRIGLKLDAAQHSIKASVRILNQHKGWVSAMFVDLAFDNERAIARFLDNHPVAQTERSNLYLASMS